MINDPIKMFTEVSNSMLRIMWKASEDIAQLNIKTWKELVKNSPWNDFTKS
jgi:hypothetical protein